MKKWEYTEATFAFSCYQEQLDELGKQGWEAYSIWRRKLSITFYLKREYNADSPKGNKAELESLGAVTRA